MAGYSSKAQPYLDAIANSIFTSSEIRDWLLAGTKHEVDYAGASVLLEEQRSVRWRNGPTKQPFWANYWCGKDSNCACRVEGSKSLESDAIFFLRQSGGARTLAVHIEFKHPGEPFQIGQPEGYPLRARCFSETHTDRPAINAHEDWLTVVFCGEDTIALPEVKFFDRIIGHSESAARIPGWPT